MRFEVFKYTVNLCIEYNGNNTMAWVSHEEGPCLPACWVHHQWACNSWASHKEGPCLLGTSGVGLP